VANRLYRSRTDRPIAGVAGGLAVWLGLDPSLVRVAWVVLAILSGGVFLLVYIVMMVVVPLAPEGWQPRGAYDRYRGMPGPGGDPTGLWGPPYGPTGGTPGADPAGDGSMPPPAASWREGWGQGPESQPIDAGRAGIIAGLFLIALGAWFLVDDYIHIDWAVAWPLFVIVAGVALIAGAARRR
jgi:phage shock protein PspC (stress-responsive transcriptional regulator)